MSEDSPLPSLFLVWSPTYLVLHKPRPLCVPRGVGYTPVSSGAVPGRSPEPRSLTLAFPYWRLCTGHKGARWHLQAHGGASVRTKGTCGVCLFFLRQPRKVR